jgi:hypothetical protein
MSGNNDHNSPENEPIAQTLKQIDLLDCLPGRADDPKSGEPIAIITVGHRKEVEHPLMLSLRDSRSLAIKLLEVLATYDDRIAQKILTKYFMTDEGRRPLVDKPIASSQPSIDRTIEVGFKDPSVQPVQMVVMGCYKAADRIILLLHCSDLSSEPTIASARVVKQKFLKFRGVRKCEIIPAIDRTHFRNVVGGQNFRIGKKVWKKLGRDELEDAIRPHRFTCID